MRRRLSLALAMASLTAACAGGSEGMVVEMFDNRFAPAQLTVEVGTEVVFRGAGRNPHNAVASDGSWSTETAFGSLDAYFDGYSIAGDRLSALQPPAWLLTSEDDPVIPVEGFRALQLPARSRLEIAPWGGHCGIIENPRLDGYAERWMAASLETTVLPRLEAAATGAG